MHGWKTEEQRTAKYKKLPKSTALVIDFCDGIHAHKTTVGKILAMDTSANRAMNLSLINAIDKLEHDRQTEYEIHRGSFTVSALGFINGHTYSLTIADKRIRC